MGKNIGSCHVCGTPIVNHFTVQCEGQDAVNVGCECLGKVTDPQVAENIQRTFASIQRQVKTDIVRPVKTRQLGEWLAANWTNYDSIRNARLDKELAENPKRFWNKPHKIEIWRNGTYCGERDATDAELAEGAETNERLQRTFWSYSQQNFLDRGWNPDTMKKVFAEELAHESTTMDFTWRKLTDEEQDRIKTLTQLKINQYIKEINHEPKYCDTKDVTWSKGRKGYVYHCTTKENAEKILKDGVFRPDKESGVTYFSTDAPMTGYGQIIFKSKSKLDLGNFGNSAPPVLWSRVPIPTTLFETTEATK
jgi:hypothetical protein